MNAGIEAGRALAFGGGGLIAAATGWGLVLASTAPIWDAGPLRRESFRPVPRPASPRAAGLTAAAALALWIVAFLALPRLPALGSAHRSVVPSSATRAAVEAWAIFAGGIVVVLAGGLGLAEVGVWLRGQAVLRYPNPRTGALLGGGLGLVAGALAAATACGVLAVPALRHGHSPAADFSAMAAWGLGLGVVTVAPALDAVRRSLPALRFMARNTTMARPSVGTPP